MASHSKAPRRKHCLKDAFAGESQANRRYLYFGKQGRHRRPETTVAALFRSTAEGRKPATPMVTWSSWRQSGDPATGPAPSGPTRDNPQVGCGWRDPRVHNGHVPRHGQDARGGRLGEIADWFETLAKAERSPCENRYAKALAELVD